MASGIAVHGRAELIAALQRGEKDVRTFFRQAEREVAEPVRRDAEALATMRITRIGLPWSRMRTGITRRSVYVAPKERGTRRPDDPRSRRNLGTLLMDRAMQPALDANEHLVAARFDEALGRIESIWDRA